ncbi:GC-rich sequence DNA-binding factor-like protein-domain-containing protein [Paraphoma chrysanthemicola]|uniref:GC-rich sequence DNA-binding factor-like protein-domain-containing protein n=1 Tax=Paraphoma chrysanthemicola TaxID=798071 RepID=A0A8K0QRW6_9PLEO|nr:GC-rich sequence DNA-binding factor-like protein-domain-containing protein [Paraphoma chrysanthemicola]
MEGDGQKRKRTFRQEPKKKPKLDDGSAKLKAGFGAKLMAKMGYKGEGGLGREGEGISEPIQVVMRGTKGGVGIVAEKSEQQRREERRKAEANGEEYVDTSEEERRKKKEKKTKARGEARTTVPRPKKTVFEMEAAGMHVPLALQSIIDATTGASTPTSGVSLRGADIVPFESSLQARVRRDLNSFSEAFEELQIEAETIPAQEWALEKELDALERQMEEAEDIRTRLLSLRTSTFKEACIGLLSLRAAYPSKPLHRESIAILHPHFSDIISSWSPLDTALEDVAAAFSELSDVVQPRSRRATTQAYTHPSEALVARNIIEEEEAIKRGTTSSYETMMLKLWLPQVSSAVTQWDIKDPHPMVHLLETWTPVLPPFVARRVLSQVTRKLSTSVHEWNPRKFKKSPHTWIVEWLPYLPPADLDPKGSGLVAEIKRKLRHALQSIDLSRGPLAGMESWRKVFGRAEFDHLLTSHLVPRFAAYLRDNLEVNPAEQDLAPLEAVFAWKGLVSDQVIGELLRAQFFPKFLDIIHQWLSSEEVVFEEVQKWIEWWRDEILGTNINALPSVASCWDEAYTLINQALDLGDARLTSLPNPRVESARASPEPPQFSKSINKEPPRPAAQVEEPTFKDVVEEFCAEENLLLIPLREAHDKTGLPLFRVTASATGRGGAVAYLKGDILWVQDKKDKSAWEPVGLDEKLIAKAEGK